MTQHDLANRIVYGSFFMSLILSSQKRITRTDAHNQYKIHINKPPIQYTKVQQMQNMTTNSPRIMTKSINLRKIQLSKEGYELLKYSSPASLLP